MKRRLVVILLPIAIAVLGGSLAVLKVRSVPRAAGVLPHEAYVWQREWHDEVREGIAQARGQLTGLTYLGAEATWEHDRFRVATAAVDYEALQAAQMPVGIALRIGSYSGPFAADGVGTRLLRDLASALLHEARAAGISPAELQLDFDCAESKLDGYRVWVEAIRREVAPVPVTFTALPCWLDRRAFKSLAASADGFVLQVHSLERPKDPDAPFTLCDPTLARKAVEKAARFGKAFRVALPTYGYALAFDPKGQYVRAYAEGGAPACPEGGRLRILRTDPAGMAALVRDWTQDRPRDMRGLIWYRLPTDKDALNWRWATLSAVIAGRKPEARMQCKAHRVEDGAVEIELANEGEADAPLAATVAACWRDAPLIAGDGLNGFEFVADEGGAKWHGHDPARRLAPGQHMKVGWLRLGREVEVGTDVRREIP
jgi:hypothetical protein